MSVTAELLFLEAKKIVDPDGRDDVTIQWKKSSGASNSQRTGLRQGDKIVFDNFPQLMHIPFDGQLEIALTQINTNDGQFHKFGTLVLDANQLGTRFGQFTDSGAEYELTYRVVEPLPTP